MTSSHTLSSTRTFTPPKQTAHLAHYPTYPPRAHVINVDWSIPEPDYAPVNFTDPSVIAHDRTKVVGGWADPEDPHDPVLVSELHQRKSMATGTLLPLTLVDGLPRNPMGRTGMCGRGILGRYGPNWAADPLVTRFFTPPPAVHGEAPPIERLEMVAIQRRDTHDWAMPGGMVDEGEKVSTTLRREFMEEAAARASEDGGQMEQAIKHLFTSGGVVVYKGFVDDPRNTDNAFMETTCAHFHIVDPVLAEKLPLHAGDDAMKVRWLEVDATQPLFRNLYASHHDMVLLAIQHQIDSAVSTPERQRWEKAKVKALGTGSVPAPMPLVHGDGIVLTTHHHDATTTTTTTTTSPTPTITVTTPQTVTVPPANAPPDRFVEVAVNIISMHNVQDQDQVWSANILLGVTWNARPKDAIDPNTNLPVINPTTNLPELQRDSSNQFVPFRPWIQLQNVCRVVYEKKVKNPGLPSLSDDALRARVNDFYNKHSPNDPCICFEMRNLIIEFVQELNLQQYPFDEQQLKLILISNPVDQVTFTHKHNAGRDDFGWPKGPFTNTIKCNLEDTNPEWKVLRLLGKDNGNRAVCLYKFQEQDKKLSAMGNVNQRCEIRIIAQREIRQLLFATMVPSFLLSSSSISIFVLHPITHCKDRLNVLYLIVLTIVSNLFVVQKRLPVLNYQTFVDQYLIGAQVFVYLVMIEASSVATVQETLFPEYDVHEIDRVFMFLLIGIYVIASLGMAIRAITWWRARKRQAHYFRQQQQRSFMEEEKRLARLYAVKRKLPSDPSLVEAAIERELVARRDKPPPP